MIESIFEIQCSSRGIDRVPFIDRTRGFDWSSLDLGTVRQWDTPSSDNWGGTLGARGPRGIGSRFHDMATKAVVHPGWLVRRLCNSNETICRSRLVVPVSSVRLTRLITSSDSTTANAPRESRGKIREMYILLIKFNCLSNRDNRTENNTGSTWHSNINELKSLSLEFNYLQPSEVISSSITIRGAHAEKKSKHRDVAISANFRRNSAPSAHKPSCLSDKYFRFRTREGKKKKEERCTLPGGGARGGTSGW